MPDAQSPSDADGGGDLPRRASLKLRDAEAVATTRRDMFGDGSLLDPLGGSPPAREGAQIEPEAEAPDAGPDGIGDAERALPEAGDGGPALPVHPPPPDASAGGSPDDFADVREADGKSERKGNGREDPRFANPAASPFAQVPQSLDSIIDSFPAEPSDRPPEPSAPDQTEFGARAAANGSPAAPMAVSSIFDGLGPAEPPGEDDGALPFGTASPDIPMPAPPQGAVLAAGWPGSSLTPAQGEHGQAAGLGDDRGFDDRGRVDDAAGAAQEAPEPPAAWDAPQSPVLAPFPEPPAPAEPLPRYAEPPAMRPFPEPTETPSAPSVPEPIVTIAAGAHQQPDGGSRYAEPSTDPARPMFDATAKIAAEANATAEALGHLKRLLGQDAPGPEPVQSAAPEAPPLSQLGQAAQFATRARAPLLPLPVPPERTGIKGVYLLGFLTGLVLALIAGLALYLLINLG